MPSFLSKVFGRKKDEKESSHSTKRRSNPSLLEGKFEAVPHNVSPIATNFPENPLSKEKDPAFSLFRPKSRTVSPIPESTKPSVALPHLTLNLSVPKEDKSRALDVVFEGDGDDKGLLSDDVIGRRRLTPAETLQLLKACSSAIERGGLETLGVMHPHWYSASPEVQRRLISLFIISLAPNRQTSTLSPTATTPSLIFNSELEYTRSPHDVAAVLRWALRHLRLEGDSFGKGNGNEPWRWYTEFVEAERSSSFPVNAYSNSLVPALPPANLQLLSATLDIITSLAAHAESNGSSGSKLSKLLGLWLLTSQRTKEGEDWPAFYERWERAGRILEHVYLSYVRDEASKHKMPLRLSELVKAYPYTRETPEDDLLPRPRFSTRRYDALLVRLDSQLPDMKTSKPQRLPLRLIADALDAEVAAESEELKQLWESLKKAVSTEDEDKVADAILGYPSFSRIFTDDTLRLLSLVSPQVAQPTSPTIILPPASPVSRPSRRRSLSLGSSPKGNDKAANGHGKSPTTGSPVSPASPTDWADFSSAGFGESNLGKNFASTLMDSDVETTEPPAPSRKSSLKKRKSTPPPTSRRSSVDNPRPLADRPEPPSSNIKTKATRINVVELDEAFIDFWSDALLDPISSAWPSFVVCQLKPSASLTTADGKSLGWLVIEQTFTYPPPPPTPSVPEPQSPRRPSSPKPSLRSNMSSRKSATFSLSGKRFSLFNTSPSARRKSNGASTVAKGGRVGEMGEILPEEDEPKASLGQRDIRESKPATGLGITGANVGSSAAAPAPTPVEPIVISPTETALPPVPVVEATPVVAEEEVVPAATEPVKVDEDIEKPTVVVPTETTVPVDVEDAEASLPPAPEQVVLTGTTPGPEVALSTSEPAALAESVEPQVAAVMEPIKEEVQAEPVVNTSGTAPVEEVIQPEEPVVEEAPQPEAHAEEPTQSGEPAQPEEPAKVEEPVQPEEPVIEPTHPVEPVTIEEPVQPEAPAAVEELHEPETDVVVEEPVQPVPAVIEEPVQPEEPAATEPEPEVPAPATEEPTIVEEVVQPEPESAVEEPVKEDEPASTPAVEEPSVQEVITEPSAAESTSAAPAQEEPAPVESVEIAPVSESSTDIQSHSEEHVDVEPKLDIPAANEPVDAPVSNPSDEVEEAKDVPVDDTTPVSNEDPVDLKTQESEEDVPAQSETTRENVHSQETEVAGVAPAHENGVSPPVNGHAEDKPIPTESELI
ncbi:hypothetical protein C8Q75DRAFT_733928 [Abortiporus biennis]|nr:hypothetical protein C8Q75DRAFT_733928 [Abortiporus biennis]